jgi:hypothetical protein
MKIYATGFVLALLSAFAGILSPTLPLGDGFQEPVNLVWGFIYGLGWFMARFAGDAASPQVLTFGALVWPVAVLACGTYLIGAVLSRHPRKRPEIIAALILSVLFVLPLDLIMNTPLRYIPTYHAMMSAVY